MEALTTTKDVRDRRQGLTAAWVARTFGAENMLPEQRALRFIEEAVELVHSMDLDPALIRKVIGHVYTKPKGEAGQEVGGVSVTLLALCEALGLSADACEVLELERVRSLAPEHFQRREQVKVDAGLYPGHAKGPDEHTQKFWNTDG